MSDEKQPSTSDSAPVPATSESKTAPVESPGFKEFIDKLPEPIKAELIRMQTFSSGPAFPPFMEKIDGQHISQGLDIFKKQIEGDLRNEELKRRYNAFYFLGAFAILAFLTFFIYPENQNIYFELLKLLFPFGFGFAAGYGIGKSKSHS